MPVLKFLTVGEKRVLQDIPLVRGQADANANVLHRFTFGLATGRAHRSFRTLIRGR